jgi:hypothetical protein
MTRSAALFCLLLGAIAPGAGGCGEEGGGPGEGGPAGKVVELSGSVTAARQGAAARPLGRGDAVFRDDTVTTAADASVTIVLAHNDARWKLAGGRSRRVDRSPAWRVERGRASASAFDDDEALPTSSAGRHSEPQAGDTRATAPAPDTSAETRVASADEAGGGAPPAPARSGKRKRSRAAEERAKGAPPLAQAPGGGGLALGAVPMAPRAEAAAGGGPALGIPGRRRALLGALSASGSRRKSELAGPVAERLGQAAELCAIGASRSGSLTLRFDIGRRGDVSRVRLDGPSPLVEEVGPCLQKKAAELHFAPRREGTTRVRQAVRFEVP